MKTSLLVLMGALLTLPTFARDFTYEYEGQTLIYTVIDEDEKTCQPCAGIFDLDQEKISTGNYPISGDLILPEVAYDGDEGYSVVVIPEFAFSFNEITSISLPSTIQTINYKAFYGCTALTTVTIPESVEIIGDEAFYGCTALTTVTIPESVESIGDAAFYGCTALTTVTIPERVCFLFMGNDTFGNCASLTSFTIPEGVDYIGAGIFSGCIGLTSVTIPKSVTRIAYSAFYGCTALTSIAIPEGVEEIHSYTFENCIGLSSVIIPASVIRIDKQAFYGCSSLTSITIPKYIRYIDEWAFGSCTALSSVYYGGRSLISGTVNIFSSETYDKATLYVTEENVLLSGTRDPWKNFKNIEAFDFSGIDEIINDFNADEPYEVYNLNGVRISLDIDNLTPGLYIIRQGKAVKKITVM